MSETRDRFVRELASSAGMVGPTVTLAEKRFDPNGKQSDAIARSIQASAIWLQESTVQDYNFDDWAHLSPELQAELDSLVREFRDYASTTTDTSGPSKEVYHKALPVFERICEIAGALGAGDGEHATEG